MHKVLEKELPFFDPREEDSAVDQSIFKRIHHLLETYRHQITQPNLGLATWTVQQILESLIHAAVIDPPAYLYKTTIASAITDAITVFLMYPKHQSH